MEFVIIQCPYCFELVEVGLDPSSRGEMVIDCEICCRPWLLNVRWTRRGEARVEVRRAQ